MKKFILALTVSMVSLACDKENAGMPVRYEISNAFADTEVTYMNGDGEVVKEWIAFESGGDVWDYSMTREQGGIVYLSAMYLDSASSVKIRILIDGKVYKEGSSNNEPDKYLTVAGTVPFR